MDGVAAWLEGFHARLPALVASAALLAAAYVVIALAKRLLANWLGRLGPLIRLPVDAIPRFARGLAALLWTVAALLVLGLWGVDVGGLWTVLVSVAAVLGVGFFATWAMVSNMTASLFLAVWRPFEPGDIVELLPEGIKGRVVDRNLMFVTLREDSGACIQVPNNLFFQKMVRVAAPEPVPDP